MVVKAQDLSNNKVQLFYTVKCKPKQENSRMSYSNNPLLPKARSWAVSLVVCDHLPLAVAARKAGVHRTTLWRWYKRWQTLGYTGYIKPLPTRSSRPHRFGHRLPQSVVDRIIYWRTRRGRCAAIVHAHCQREGTSVSLASVKRVLKRLGYVVRPRWKRYRVPVARPLAQAPGTLVQTDTVHLINPFTKQRVYLYTLIDVYSRWAYVEYHDHISQRLSYQFLQRGQAWAGFPFGCVQADNGPEFGAWLKDMLASKGILLRHSRVRKPNDNAHIERFNRTIQEEGLLRKHPQPAIINQQLFDYLAYYNEERLHSSLQYRTPLEMLQSC
jgi:transposase InsO family protein